MVYNAAARTSSSSSLSYKYSAVILSVSFMNWSICLFDLSNNNNNKNMKKKHNFAYETVVEREKLGQAWLRECVENNET